MTASVPRTSPELYRFTVYAVTELDPRLMSGEWGSVVVVAGVPFLLGKCLWEEPAGREVEWDVPRRVRSAMEHAGRLATLQGDRVMLGTKSFGSTPFVGACLIGPSDVLSKAVAS